MSGRRTGTAGLKTGLAEMLKGGVIMDVTGVGGVESLIEHRATSEGAASTAPPVESALTGAVARR